jgi:outer membrane protein TolC
MAKPVYSPALASSLLAGLLRAGGKSNFEVQVAELHLREADLGYRIASVRLRPKFNATAAYSLQNSTYATPVSVSQTGISQQTIEVNARWSIFDGFATRGAKLEALTDKRYWQRRLQIASETVLDEAQQLERMIALDARAMEFSEIRRAGAEVGVRRAEEEVKRGNAPQTYIDAATGDLRLGEYNNALARAAFLSDWSSFVSLAGDDPALNSLPARYAREKQ